MRTLLVAAVLTASVFVQPQPRPAPTFDPAGKWTFSTKDEQGAAVSGTMEIAGKPGAYTGTIAIANAPDRTIQISDVFTSPTGMVVMASLLDNSGTAVIKVWKDADGKLQAGWGAVRGVIPAAIERAK